MGWLYGASGPSAMDCLFVLQLAAVGCMVLGLAWLCESAPAIARWLEYRKVRRDVRLKRNESSVRRAARVRVLGI